MLRVLQSSVDGKIRNSDTVATLVQVLNLSALATTQRLDRQSDRTARAGDTQDIIRLQPIGRRDYSERPRAGVASALGKYQLIMARPAGT